MEQVQFLPLKMNFFKKFFNKFIYLFLTVLGLRFCARAFSSCGERGPLFIAVRGPLTVAASRCGARLQMRRLSSCGARAQLLRGMWDPPGPGLEPVSPASAGRLSTTAPPGKPKMELFKPSHEFNSINQKPRYKKCTSLFVGDNYLASFSLPSPP